MDTIKHCTHCNSVLAEGWEDGWLWCVKCRYFYWLNPKDNQWRGMTTVEAGAFVMIGDYPGEGDVDQYNSWLIQQLIPIMQAGASKLLEISEDYESIKDIPEDVLEKHNQEMMEAVTWQLAWFRDDDPSES